MSDLDTYLYTFINFRQPKNELDLHRNESICNAERHQEPTYVKVTN